jgi:iron(III) transport system substrate-binding protein
LAVLAAATVLAAACAPAAPPAPAAAPAQPAAAPAARADTAEWDRVLAAARQEGKVTVLGPTGADLPPALVAPFQQKYGIAVEMTQLRGAEIPPKVLAERQANQYLWDVYVGGGTQLWNPLLPSNTMDPIEPALILPDVKDPQHWRGGGIEYLDEGKRAIVMTPFQRGTLFVNPTMVDPASFKSYKDLLDPRWKGQIVSDDPRNPGPGNAMFLLFLLHPELGPDFIRALARQELTLLRDYVQQVDLVARGRYPILIGNSDNIAEERMKAGVPIHIVDPRQLRELSDISPANGDLALFNRAPHPNAARVYINWLLSQEGQTLFVEATGYISNRLDVTTEHALPWRVPIPGAIKSYDKRAADSRDALQAVLAEALGSN